MGLLVINSSDSRCGQCGRPADPREASHERVPGWNGPEVGCGAYWTRVGSEYDGLVAKAARELRPDLRWVGTGWLGYNPVRFVPYGPVRRSPTFAYVDKENI